MVLANNHYEQEAAFNKFIRMTICSYLPIKDALKMKALSTKEMLNYENSAIARDKRVLRLDFSLSRNYFKLQNKDF